MSSGFDLHPMKLKEKVKSFAFASSEMLSVAQSDGKRARITFLRHCI